MATVTRPRAFVSSTIGDFRDLRDGLKFWLEEMGYEVQMSEHTDFKHRPESGAFEACFDAIRDSKYYVLLIGDNRGSWYSEKDRITVTQQEYRTAYDSFLKTGVPIPIVLARQRVIEALSERRAAGVSSEAGSTLEDPEFTTCLLQEVRREEETEKAKKGEGPYPKANWITPFASFRELTDALRVGLRLRGPLPRVAQEETLRHEFTRNLSMLMYKHNGKPFYRHFYLDSVRQEVELPSRDFDGIVPLTFQQIKRTHMYTSVGIPIPEVLVRTALNEAISSGSFLIYDTGTDSYRPSALLEALYRLREELDVYAARYETVGELRASIWPLWEAVRVAKADGQLSVLTLISLFGLHDSQKNVGRLLFAILRFLNGHDDTIDVQFRPLSPIPGEDERIESERVSQDDIKAWLEEDSPYLALGSRDLTEEQETEIEAGWAAVREGLGEDRYRDFREQLVARVAEELPRTPEEWRVLVGETLEQIHADEQRRELRSDQS